MKKFLNILKNIGFVPVIIVLSPIIIIAAIINQIQAFKPRKALRFLENKGFVFSKQRKPYILKWTFDNICIMFENNDYKISFDCNKTNPTFISMFKSDIGSEEDRQKLKGVLLSFENAHPRDKMEGYPNIHIPHVQFINDNLAQLISYKQ